MNETNRSLNGTRHAEFVGIAQILSKHPASVLKQTDLYVTVEPCVMCASVLRQHGIRAAYFGCLNDRFGGAGGVLSIQEGYLAAPEQNLRPSFGSFGLTLWHFQALELTLLIQSTVAFSEKRRSCC